MIGLYRVNSVRVGQGDLAKKTLTVSYLLWQSFKLTCSKTAGEGNVLCDISNSNICKS